MDLVLGGVDIEKEPRFRAALKLREGNVDDLAKPDTVLLFEDQARRLEVKVGDAITLSAPTARGVNNTVDLRVAAIARNIGILSSFSAFMPSETLRRLYNLNDRTTGAIHLYLKDPSRSAQVAARLRDGLAQAGWRVMDPDPRPYWEKLFAKVNAEDWTGQKLDVTTWEDELTFLSWILSAILGITGILIFILLVIVVIGILNTLAIAIRERTREIGTLRAIGMQRRRVLTLFLLEAGMLGLAGAAAGAAVGLAIAAGVNAAQVPVPESVQMFLMQQRLTLAVPLRSALGDVLFIAAVTTLAALVPAFHAARLRPVTAMHHIG
jgi:ABC-type lipoprotein release transport system permease subunit